jgi:hypothetical protein
VKPPCREAPSRPRPEAADDAAVLPVERGRGGNWEDRQRSRSIPRSLSLLCGAWSIFMVWLSVLAATGSLVMKLLGHPGPWGAASVVSLIVLAMSLVVSLGISLTRKCPLCHGTPLHSRPCPKHRLANRWPPLTHRATVVVRILTTLSFRCMYCGTPFRLFKKSSRQR